VRELELKFALPLSLEDSLARDGAGDRVERVWSCYYDTADGALARARMALRVRRHGERWVQTLKADTGGHFDRFEWERPIAGPAPERDALPPEDDPQGSVVHRSFGQLRALFETDFERRSRHLELPDGLRVELAQDRGEVRCGDRVEPIREVELERLAGSAAAFFEWALDWARREQACLLIPTKNERGLRLAARLPRAPSPVRARPTAPSAAARPDVAAADVIRDCIAHACANLEPILASDDPEGPHQLRVALRRLRAALRLFELRERDPGWARVDREAARLADAAGEVRDLDVFEAGAMPELRARFPGDAALEALARATVDARDAARRALRRTVTAPATTGFVLGTLALAERLAAPADDAGGASTVPATDAGPASAPARPDTGEAYDAYAHRRLHALLARVRRRARRAHGAADWHRVRLAVKTLRYALDFTAALPRPADPARAQALLARWQERLGAGQDRASARDVAAAALGRPDVPAESAVRAIALIDGWLAFGAPAHRDPQAHARRTLRALRDALGPPPARRGAPSAPDTADGGAPAAAPPERAVQGACDNPDPI
jgi:triphosphatase